MSNSLREIGPMAYQKSKLFEQVGKVAGQNRGLPRLNQETKEWTLGEGDCDSKNE